MGDVLPFRRRGAPPRPAPAPAQEAIPAGGQVARCDRCGEQLRVADTRNVAPDPRAIRRAKGAMGYCPECAVCAWFVRMDLRAEVRDPASLLLPHVQEGFLAVMKSTGADLGPGEIFWERVVANWNLPFDVAGRRVAPDKALAAALRKLRNPRRPR